jgi:mono/diheme cytochrome c family protein
MSKKKKQSAASSPESAEPSSKTAGQVNLLSEGAEPRAEQVSIPMALVVILTLLVFVSDMHLMENRGEFNPVVYQPHATLEDIQAEWPVDPGVEWKKKGKKVYDSVCAACHQANGLGTAGSFPPLAGSDWVLTEGPNRIIRLILHGIQGPITVNGQAFNNAMPPWGAVLPDDQIAAVVTYIRAEWGNKASAVTAEEVAKIRTAEAKRELPWSAEELLKLPVK